MVDPKVKTRQFIPPFLLDAMVLTLVLLAALSIRPQFSAQVSAPGVRAGTPSQLEAPIVPALATPVRDVVPPPAATDLEDPPKRDPAAHACRLALRTARAS